jgi:hypothetical protein
MHGWSKDALKGIALDFHTMDGELLHSQKLWLMHGGTVNASTVELHVVNSFPSTCSDSTIRPHQVVF